MQKKITKTSRKNYKNVILCFKNIKIAKNYGKSKL